MRRSTVAAILGLGVAAPAAEGQSQSPRLELPIACRIGATCEVQHYVDRDPGPGARDYRCGRRTYQGHKGTDIRLPDMAAQRRGVPVLAAAPGRVARLRDGVPDVSVRASGAPSVSGIECGNGVVIDHGGGWETQYCHLAQGSLSVRPGQAVRAGAPLGRVGLSGSTEFPHLHFQLQRAGRIVDPFTGEGAQACGAGTPLWTPKASAALAYRPATILNLGFSGGRVEAQQVESAAVAPATRTGAYLVGYGRATGLLTGDVLRLRLSRGSETVAETRLPPLDRDKAQYFLMVGKRRTLPAWPSGAYQVRMQVVRAGRIVADRQAAGRF